VVVGDEGGLLLDCFCHKEVTKRATQDRVYYRTKRIFENRRLRELVPKKTADLLGYINDTSAPFLESLDYVALECRVLIPQNVPGFSLTVRCPAKHISLQRISYATRISTSLSSLLHT